MVDNYKSKWAEEHIRNTQLKNSIKRIILGFQIFFYMFAVGVIGKYAVPNHWIGRIGELSVDWGIIVFTLALLYIRYKMRKKEYADREEEQ